MARRRRVIGNLPIIIVLRHSSEEVEERGRGYVEGAGDSQAGGTGIGVCA